MTFVGNLRRVVGFRTARDYLLGTALFAVIYVTLDLFSDTKPPHWSLLIAYVAYCTVYTLFASWRLVSGAWTPRRWARTTLVFCIPISLFVGYTASTIPHLFLLFGLFIIGIGLPMIGQLRAALWVLTLAVYLGTYLFGLWKLHPEYLFNSKQSVALSSVMFAAITYWLARISWFVEEASKKSTRTLVVTRKQKRELDRISKELRLKDKSLARDLNFARNFQLNQLPDLEIFNTGGFKSAMHYIALDTVGGDIIDMVRFSPDRIGVFVGDVSGHGVRAAMVAMMARVGFANLCKMSDDPAIVAAALNAFLCRSLENDRSCYMTAIYVIIDRSTMQMHLTCAGHTPAILIRTNHTIEEIDTHPSLFLGVEPDQGYKTTTVSVQPSDKLLLYTDGLTEPLNDAGEQYGERVFGEFLRSRAGLEPSEILAGLAVSMEGFTTENLRDDVAIVCVKVE